MRTIDAAVLRDTEAISIESIELEDPGPNEVLIDLQASGVCHTDYHFYAGDHEVPLPAVLGHEGAGIVDAIGDKVTAVDPGDHVVLSLLPSCGLCSYCVSGRPYLCQSALNVRFTGTLLNGERRLYDGDEPLNHFYAQSSFATAAVVTEESVVPIREDVPFEVVAALGCGATTGIGAVLNTADIDAGERIAVFGCGGTGMSAVLGACVIGASEIIAIDVDEQKLAVAADQGATLTINPAEVDPVEKIEDVGGVDYAFEFVGHNDLVRQQAIEAVSPGGTVVLSGAATNDASVNLSSVIGQGKSIVGNVAGSVRPRADIPRYIEMYERGDLPLDVLVDSTYNLHDVEVALQDLAAGRVTKPTLMYD